MYPEWTDAQFYGLWAEGPAFSQRRAQPWNTLPRHDCGAVGPTGQQIASNLGHEPLARWVVHARWDDTEILGRHYLGCAAAWWKWHFTWRTTWTPSLGCFANSPESPLSLTAWRPSVATLAARLSSARLFHRLRFRSDRDVPPQVSRDLRRPWATTAGPPTTVHFSRKERAWRAELAGGGERSRRAGEQGTRVIGR